MQYEIKRGWFLKELAPLTKLPTCKVFKLVASEPYQGSYSITKDHFSINFTTSESALTIHRDRELIALLKGKPYDLGRITHLTLFGSNRCLIITEPYEISNNKPK